LVAVLFVVVNCVIAFASKGSYVFYRNIELWEQSNEVFSFIFAALASIPICWVLYYERKNNYIVYTLASRYWVFNLNEYSCSDVPSGTAPDPSASGVSFPSTWQLVQNCKKTFGRK